MTTSLGSALTLPCGLVLPNRLAKAAMTEQLGVDGDPSPRLLRLYEVFRDGGLGLVMTGNAMVHRDHREHPRNVVIDERTKDLAGFARATGPRGVVQLSHPGRQALWTRGQPVAPSPVKLALPLFKEPRGLQADEIEALVERFADAAHACDLAGFAGVEVHGAHGYLVSQFLSPLANQRRDPWGGSLENRARFLLAIVERTRAKVRAGFAVMVKLNSADFQRGGFDAGDAIAVARMLDGKIDLLEISGGSYESQAMVGQIKTERTSAREAYFLELAEELRKHTATPLMLTGGFRTVDAMESAVASGAIDLVGLARPLAMEPGFARRVLAGDRADARTGRDKLGVRALDGMLAAQFYVEQLHRLADGKEPDAHLSRLWTVAHAAWMSRG